MLFLPWTNEEEDLIHINHEERFELYKDIIQQKRSEYIHREANEFEQALEEHMEKKEIKIHFNILEQKFPNQ